MEIAYGLEGSLFRKIWIGIPFNARRLNKVESPMKKLFLKIAFLILNVLTLGAYAQTSNLLTNPGFVPATTADYRVFGAIAPPSWQNIGPANGPLPNNIYINDPVNPTPNPMPSYRGSQFFYDLGGFGNSNPSVGDGVTQTFTTVPGRLYRLTFGHNSEANGSNLDAQAQGITEIGTDSLRVRVGDQNVVFTSPYNSSSPGYGNANGGNFGGAIVGAFQMPWVERTLTFRASATSTTVSFTINELSSTQYPTGDTLPNIANSQIVAMPLIEEVVPTITVTKVLGGTGRISPDSDQFTVSINSAGAVLNSTLHSTTQGSGLAVTAGSGTTGVFLASTGVQYAINEAMAAGSASSLNQYATRLSCTNSFAGGTNVSALTALGTNFTLTSGDTVVCTITNSPAVPRLTLKKISQGGVGTFVFNGSTNANGFSTDSSYVITTSTAGTAATGTTVTLNASNVLTEIQETVPAGWSLLGASCIDANAARSGNPSTPFGTLNGNVLQIPAANARFGADLQCTFTNTNAPLGNSLSGKVLLDTGAGTGTPHDAVQNGSEVGHSGVRLSLTDCANTVFSTATSAADGSFSLSLLGVPSGQAACLVESLPLAFNAVSVNVGTTAGTFAVASTTLRFTPASNTSYTGVVLGNAPQSLFFGDGAEQAPAGLGVVYAHTYVAGSAGSVVFGLTDAPLPASLIWDSVLFLDVNCNGTLDATDTLLTSAIAVRAGQRVCILDRVTSQSGAPIGAKDITTVRATESWAVPTLVPTGRTQVLQNTDTTTVSTAGLLLQKDVRTLTVCPADAAASLANATPYITGGSARPGDFLEYRLRFTNPTAQPLTGIQIFDSVPAFTQFAHAQCLDAPSAPGVTCTVSSQPSVGAATGSVSWTLQDAAGNPSGLQPLATGSVSFCLKVQQ